MNNNFINSIRGYIYSHSLLLLLCLFVFEMGIQAQHKNLPLNYFLGQTVEHYADNYPEKIIHTGVRPLQESFVPAQVVNYVYTDTGKYYYDIGVLLFQKNLLQINKGDVHLTADPLFDFQIGTYNANQGEEKGKVMNNTRGFRITGDITSKFSFETRFYENQLFYPFYADSIADSKNIAFGLGRSKIFKDVGHDVGNSSGYISYGPTDWINIQLGHGKFFFGNGYRSMLLSDNAANYPYISSTWRFGKGHFQYKTINAWMQSLERIPVTLSAEALFKPKAAAFHYLSWKPIPKLEFGLFEGTVFKQYQDTLGTLTPDYSFYMPIIGSSAAINGLQSQNNVLLGITMNTHFKSFQLYAQLAVDDLDKIGYQVGAKWSDFLGIERTWIQIEYNHATSYMYSHSNEYMLQNYSHMNQELAHPIGAAFDEVLFIGHFEKRRWFANVKVLYTLRERLGGGTWGENILLPNDQNLTAIAPEKINTMFWNIEGGYRLNIKTNFQIFGSFSQRELNSTINTNDQSDWFWSIGMRTNLSNFYSDL